MEIKFRQFINIPYSVALLIISIGFTIVSIICSFLIEVNIYNVIEGNETLLESYLYFEVLNDVTNYIPFILFIIQSGLIVLMLVFKNKIELTKIFKDILLYASIVIIVIDLICLISSNGVIINNVNEIIEKKNTIGKAVSLVLQVAIMIASLIYKFIDKKESENVIG